MSDLDDLRICAILHDIGKPECWLKGKPWPDHVLYTHEIVRDALGDDYAAVAMRHHAGPSYPEDYHPKTELERIIYLADNIASGADRPEELLPGSPLPRLPLILSNVISGGDKVRAKQDERKLSILVTDIKQKLAGIGKRVNKSLVEAYHEIYNFLRDALLFLPADTCLPINDVSLWHHLKLTTAIATCIWLNGGYKGDNVRRYEFSLLSGDADKVSKYINISRRLSDLRAGSRLVEKATTSAVKAIEEELGPECIIFGGGGGFLAISPLAKSQTLLKKAKEKFESITGGDLTITVNSINADGVKVKDHFGELWAEAIHAMRKIKTISPPLLAKSIEEGIQLCDVCGLRPAEYLTEKVLSYDASPRPEKLCEPCYRRRTSGEGKGVDLDEISDERKFIGMIKADGDNLGEVINGKRIEQYKKTMTPSRLSTVSDMIDSICTSKLDGIVVEHKGECIFSGGDDVLAVLPGEKAFECALELSQTFLNEMANQVALSAGLVLFKERFPCYITLEVVSQLIENAKHQPGKSSIDFEIISATEVTPTDVNFESRGKQRKRGFTKRPYKWDEFSKLVDFTKFLGGGTIPPTQVNTIAGIARSRGKEDAQVFVKYQMGRGLVSWQTGEELLKQIENGRYLDAFEIYNSFYRR